MTLNTPHRQRVNTTRGLLAAGVAGPILYVAVFTITGWLRPGYSAMAAAVSDLGVGSSAWIHIVNSVLFGLLLVAFAVGFGRAMTGILERRATTVATGLIAATGTGVAAAGLFPAEPPTEILHFLLGFVLAIASAIATAFYVGRRLRGVRGWQGLARYSTWTGIGGLGLVVLSFVALNPTSPMADAGVGGLIERLLVVEVFAWYTVMGVRLLRRASPPPR